jgi:hypothetical protein
LSAQQPGKGVDLTLVSLTSLGVALCVALPAAATLGVWVVLLLATRAIGLA